MDNWLFPKIWSYYGWLVVDLSLWKMMEWVTVGMMTFPTAWKVIKVMFQTTNQMGFWILPLSKRNKTLGIQLHPSQGLCSSERPWWIKNTGAPFMVKNIVNFAGYKPWISMVITCCYGLCSRKLKTKRSRIFHIHHPAGKKHSPFTMKDETRRWILW